MLNQIQIKKKDGRVLTLPIYDATNYKIKDIQGLDPVKANIVTSNFSHIDGAQYQASRREMRNLIIKLGIESSVGNTVQDLRKTLYSYFMPKDDVKIKFVRDSLEVFTIEGKIESFESPLFVKEPEATISVLCFDPDFYSDTELTFEGLTTNNNTDQEFDYDGDVDSGFIFSFTPQTTISEFSLQNTLPDGTVTKILFESLAEPILSGNTITISTNPGDKYIRINRSGVLSSILWAMDPTSSWIKLNPGINRIRVNCSTNNIPYTISYYNRFGGL